MARASLHARMLARSSLGAHREKRRAYVLGTRTEGSGARMSWTRASGWRTHLLDACKRDARVSWRVQAGARVFSWCTHVLDCAFAQGDVGVWSPLLCTLVQCRCGRSSPKDAGVWA